MKQHTWCAMTKPARDPNPISGECHYLQRFQVLIHGLGNQDGPASLIPIRNPYWDSTATWKISHRRYVMAPLEEL